jgi:hypothetical protein
LAAGGAAGVLLVRAGGMDLPPPPMRLACTSEGAAMDAMVTAITAAAEVRKEVLMGFLEIKRDKSGWPGLVACLSRRFR